MSEQTMTLELSAALSLPAAEVVRRGLLALVEKEIRLAEAEIANIRERYDVFSKEALHEAIRDGRVVPHPAWEDYIVWKNKESYIKSLREIAAR